jgi:hypothetical protein
MNVNKPLKEKTNKWVYGYHGTTDESADLICENGFKFSDANAKQSPDGSWLGDGVYFWQDAPIRAWKWAEMKASERGSKPAVVRAIINLQDCMDLLDIDPFSFLKRAHNLYIEECRRKGVFSVAQVGLKIIRDRVLVKSHHYLDCKIINHAIQLLWETEGIRIPAIRAVFVQGRAVFKTSCLYNLSHVQVSVRENAVLKDVFQLVK